MTKKHTIVVAVLGGIVASGFALAAMPQPAAAQSRGIFGALFGFLGGARDERFAPPTTNGYGSNSYAPFDRRDGGGEVVGSCTSDGASIHQPSQRAGRQRWLINSLRIRPPCARAWLC